MNLAKALKFMTIAEAMAAMSKDPSTRVGSVAIDDNYNILSTAYNGFPRGVADHESRYNDRPTKYALIAHAEQNLVAQAAYTGTSLRGSTVLLTSLFPCSACAKSLIQAGVARVIAPMADNERWEGEAVWAGTMFVEAGVEVVTVKRTEKGWEFA